MFPELISRRYRKTMIAVSKTSCFRESLNNGKKLDHFLQSIWNRFVKETGGYLGTLIHSTIFCREWFRNQKVLEQKV